MKETTLINSLKWLIEKGERIESMEDVREYIDVYEKVKTGLIEYSTTNENYKIINDNLPVIELKKFNNPYYLFKTFVFEKIRFGYRSLRGPSLEDLFPDDDPYPAKTKYIIEINHQTTKIANEIRSRLGILSDMPNTHKFTNN